MTKNGIDKNRKVTSVSFFRERKNFKMANMEKYSFEDIKGLAGHLERSHSSYSNEFINQELSYKNYNLGPEREKSQIDFIKSSLEKYQHSNRRDLKICSDWVITCPQNVPETRQNEFFKLTYDFLVERYTNRSGLSENDLVVSSFVHLDETNAHMHFCMINVIKNEKGQRFCAKELFNRKELASFHSDFKKFMENHNFFADVNNKETLFKRVIDKNGNEHYIALNPSDLKQMNVRLHEHSHAHERSF